MHNLTEDTDSSSSRELDPNDMYIICINRLKQLALKMTGHYSDDQIEHSIYPVKNCEFSFLHVNVRSLAKNQDILKLYLNRLGWPFKVMGIQFILNLSSQTGIVPVELKIAKIILLYKDSDLSLFDNYRPISILPVIATLLENFVYQIVELSGEA